MVEDPAGKHNPMACPVQFRPPVDGVDGSVTLFNFLLINPRIKHGTQVGEVEDGQEAKT